MPGPYGVTTTGFNKKLLSDIVGEMQTSEAGLTPPVLNFSPNSVISQMNNILGDKLREMWDVAEAVYSQLYPDSSESSALDSLASINGITRKAATYSTVHVTCSGTPGTLLPAGRILKTSTDGTQFSSISPATIGGGGTVDVIFQGITTGPLVAPAGTLTIIFTPVSGWTSATNPLDATLGQDLETDADFRDRRITVLATPGAGTVDAVLAAVRAVAGVTEALIFENTTLAVDSSGVPAKSFETVVENGIDNDIAAAIASKKSGGIQAYGTTNVVVADSMGNNHTIGFSRPVDVNIYVAITVSCKLAQFGGGDQAAGILAVQEAIVAYGATLGIGDDVIALRAETASFDVPGVFDVTAFKIDTANPPVLSANIAISNHQQSKFDTSRITVTVVNAG